FLDLTLDDVGASIELVYTPMCKDGTKGSPKNVVESKIQSVISVLC
ncbi:outer arm dynein light chain 1, partial [Trifolium medium]|nr:outer arm dynein light chain 1 [Trifolium medium]